mgnify:FL=1
MASKTILKKKRQQAVVQVMGTGNATVSMQELALADETFDTANIVVNLSAVYFSTDGNVILSRNGNTVVQLYGTDNWEMAQQSGFVFNQDSKSNVLVNFGSNNGTAVLVLTKQAGYIEPDQQTKR